MESSMQKNKNKWTIIHQIFSLGVQSLRDIFIAVEKCNTSITELRNQGNKEVNFTGQI